MPSSNVTLQLHDGNDDDGDDDDGDDDDGNDGDDDDHDYSAYRMENY